MLGISFETLTVSLNAIIILLLIILYLALLYGLYWLYPYILIGEAYVQAWDNGELLSNKFGTINKQLEVNNKMLAEILISLKHKC
jgi:hypothetical protein